MSFGWKSEHTTAFFPESFQGAANSIGEDGLSSFSGSGGSQTCNSASGAFSEALNVLKRGAQSVLVSSSPHTEQEEILSRGELVEVLRQFILYRCSLNEHCRETDFDHTALDALGKMPFLQAMQTVEHFSASVSSRIQKKSAYLMGILRGQEAHWDKFLLSHGLGNALICSPQTLPVANLKLKGKQILDMPSDLLLFIGRCSLRGNCLPSDFTPEVCLSLHNLTLPLAIKAVSAFNTNKRIIAGPKGGVINRARFFLRLIQNVSEQCSNVSTPQDLPVDLLGIKTSGSPEFYKNSTDFTSDEKMMNVLEKDFTNVLSLHHQNDKNKTEIPSATESKFRDSTHLEFNLEQLADLEFSTAEGVSMNTPMSSVATSPMHYASTTYPSQFEIRLRQLEYEIRIRDQREQMLLLELTQTRNKLRLLQGEYLKLRNILGMYHQ